MGSPDISGAVEEKGRELQEVPGLQAGQPVRLERMDAAGNILDTLEGPMRGRQISVNEIFSLALRSRGLGKPQFFSTPTAIFQMSDGTYRLHTPLSVFRLTILSRNGESIPSEEGKELAPVPKLSWIQTWAQGMYARVCGGSSPGKCGSLSSGN